MTPWSTRRCSHEQLEIPPGVELSPGSIGNLGRDEARAGLGSSDLGNPGDRTAAHLALGYTPTCCSQWSRPVSSRSTDRCVGFGGTCGRSTDRAASGACRRVA